MDEDLKALRARIDGIDDAILKLVSERAGIAQQVGRTKNGEKIYRPEREAQIVRRLRDTNPGPLSGDVVERLIREIISACRALEQITRVAYLGPAGTFSQQAVHKHFGHEAEAIAEIDIDTCFHAVETGRADFAVVPVENSTEGSVGRTLDLIVSSSLKICSEVMLPIHQTLMRKQGNLDGIVRVYGHAQSLAQCQQWLSRHLPNAERVSVVSNSEGARLAVEEPDAATLGSEAAAELYGLVVVEARVEDEVSNTTRFLVLGQADAAPSGCDKTALVMGAQNQPGSVVKLLQPFADAGISMSKFESRPARSSNWEYLFFVVCNAHRQDPKMVAALAEVEARAAFLKVLGSYPAASA
ncbi:MAG: prephenate dehydratase [Sulfuriferula multivorans]|uniref:Bifunctional chorismate mutase/prephenate dehydratase n=1 Tax=Sulfuriferula multivorans TaxID=1559896 RepID=A0A7C9NR76_9PROT|nr:prephenate dehydratase [Sulfuriferula multivorans]